MKKLTKRQKKENRNGKTRHHIVPKSREAGSPRIALIDDGDHKRYHALFGNATPVEILQQLVEYYWAGRYEFVNQFQNTYQK